MIRAMSKIDTPPAPIIVAITGATGAVLGVETLRALRQRLRLASVRTMAILLRVALN